MHTYLSHRSVSYALINSNSNSSHANFISHSLSQEKFKHEKLFHKYLPLVRAGNFFYLVNNQGIKNRLQLFVFLGVYPLPPLIRNLKYLKYVIHLIICELVVSKSNQYSLVSDLFKFGFRKSQAQLNILKPELCTRMKKAINVSHTLTQQTITAPRWA